MKDAPSGSKRPNPLEMFKAKRKRGASSKKDDAAPAQPPAKKTSSRAKAPGPASEPPATSGPPAADTVEPAPATTATVSAPATGPLPQQPDSPATTLSFGTSGHPAERVVYGTLPDRFPVTENGEKKYIPITGMDPVILQHASQLTLGQMHNSVNNVLKHGHCLKALLNEWMRQGKDIPSPVFLQRQVDQLKLEKQGWAGEKQILEGQVHQLQDQVQQIQDQLERTSAACQSACSARDELEADNSRLREGSSRLEEEASRLKESLSARESETAQLKADLTASKASAIEDYKGSQQFYDDAIDFCGPFYDERAKRSPFTAGEGFPGDGLHQIPRGHRETV